MDGTSEGLTQVIVVRLELASSRAFCMLLTEGELQHSLWPVRPWGEELGLELRCCVPALLAAVCVTPCLNRPGLLFWSGDVWVAGVLLLALA